VRRLERSLLPAAGSGHGAGEEELEEEGPRPSDAGGLLRLVPRGAVPGSQLSTLTRHGGRSATLLFSPISSFSRHSLSLPPFLRCVVPE